MLFVTLAAGACFIASPSVARAQEVPPPLRRSMPGAGHAVLQALVGTWRVEHSIYLSVGTRDRPAVFNDIICRREWVAGGRFLQDVTEGTMAAARTGARDCSVTATWISATSGSPSTASTPC